MVHVQGLDGVEMKVEINTLLRNCRDYVMGENLWIVQWFVRNKQFLTDKNFDQPNIKTMRLASVST